MSSTGIDRDATGRLTTEAVDPRYADIDRLPIAELARLMNEADTTVPGAVAAELPHIVPALEAVSERMAGGGRLVYVGAGTPGRIGVLDASESPPTFGTSPEQVFGIIAGGPGAIVSPIEGAEDDPEAGRLAVAEAGVGPGDSVIGIASSGRTPFVIAAVEEARRRGAVTVGLSCNADAALSRAAEFPIEVVVGPEFISGSTRLKAGTAQKLVLNMFSTIVMIRLGKTYGNLMVDVRATNDKLRARAVRIVDTITGAGPAESAAVLESSGFDVKAAVVRIVRGVGLDEARHLLDASDGRLRRALEAGEEVTS
ncbi:N-acetylmuramic acid 6-phosphate etherase [Herbiconiux flava]|uniref:N-acetylmuramic acid 6-phosphate etherase n=1 Tax=Herbiconiux flava TaxID=881268 RepID=A0A852S9M8_9MICO|nr:N-acetylmuramic acid 6-phosphate etherase [Herbiconiux flava]NYD69928.1 N-acetylmuramic acid 6-phosphate etherase [Herbiconiux flava]GLK16678.1 N-acetylmuramic acid 6-phosphate etherase [Herbiconiux flava]